MTQLARHLSSFRPNHHTLAVSVLAVATAVLAAGCRVDSIEAPGPTVSVCHVVGAIGTASEIPLSDLPARRSQGDYVTQMVVSSAPRTDDGVHFARISDALAEARAGRIARGELEKAACRITITASAEIIRGTAGPSNDPALERFPIVIDVPDISLRGALAMRVDATGRATGISATGFATHLSPSPALVVEGGGGNSQLGHSQEIIIVNGHPDGPKGNGAEIEGFVFSSGREPTDTVLGGRGIMSLRVKGLLVRGNRFEGGFTEAIDLRASDARVERNHLAGPGSACDICIAGPGEFTVRDNRLLAPGGIPGILVVPATILPVSSLIEQYALPASAVVTTLIANNDVRGHVAKPVGTGIRLGGIGVGAPTVTGTNKATVTGNNLVGNTFGIIVEAAFPVATGSLRGDIELTTNGNTIAQSCQNDLLVSFSRHTTGLGLTNQPFLRHSTYTLTLGSDIPWGPAWYAHPDGFGNELVVNGQLIANGSRRAYDAARVCGE